MNKVVLILASILFSAFTFAAEPTLKYLVRQPKVKTDIAPPLIVLLHGIGSNEKDLFSFADQLPVNAIVVAARAPISLGNDGYAWFKVDFSSGTRKIDTADAEQSRELLIQFLSDLKSKFNYDSSQVYLCGFSQGGIMSYSVALTRPDLVHGIAVLSGRLLDEIKPRIAHPEKLKSLRIFVVHGTKDDVIPVSMARSSVDYLKSKGLEPLYMQHDIGHQVNQGILNDLVNWLGQKAADGK